MEKMRTIEIAADVDNELDGIADRMGITKPEALAYLVREHATPLLENWSNEERSALDEAIRAGLEDADAGRTVPWQGSIERLRASLRERQSQTRDAAVDTSA